MPSKQVFSAKRCMEQHETHDNFMWQVLHHTRAWVDLSHSLQGCLTSHSFLGCTQVKSQVKFITSLAFPAKPLGQLTDRGVRTIWDNREVAIFSETRKWLANAKCPVGFHAAISVNSPGELDLYQGMVKRKISSARRVISDELAS